MNLYVEREDFSGKITFKGEVSAIDLIKLDLDQLDRALLNDAEDSSSDILLKLEMIFRRAEEQGLYQRPALGD